METQRLRLRPYEESDLNAAYRLFSDAEMMTYYPAPFSLEKTKEWLEWSITHYQQDQMGLWAVVLKKTGELIGDCGFVKQTIDGEAKIELGYHIGRGYWRQGYGTEATRAMLAYGRQQLGLTEVISIIDPLNQASIQLAKKNQFQQVKSAFIFNKNHAIYQKFM